MSRFAAELGGPVSAALEADVRREVQRHGIVVWLDKDGHYTRFVDRLAALRAVGSLPYAVLGFRGSHLELMLALEHQAGGTTKPLLLVHVPGYNEETIKATPLLELYLAGVRYRKALATLVSDSAAGKVRPEDIADFQAKDGLTLDAADAWLAGNLDRARSGFAALLEGMSLASLVDELHKNGPLASRLSDAADAAVLWQHLAIHTGISNAWRDAQVPAGATPSEDAAVALASWVMCVEYVHDLRRPPFEPLLMELATLPAPLVEACRTLAAHLRERHAAFYLQTAQEIEERLEVERVQARAEDLGRIDTFRFEEEKILEAALAALGAHDYSAALAWAEPRLAGSSFWLQGDGARRNAWLLVDSAARLGLALQVAGPGLAAAGRAPGKGPASSSERPPDRPPEHLEDAVDRYTRAGAAVDRAHRQLEQQRARLLYYPKLPMFEVIRGCLDGMRAAWLAWADAWARDFTALCRRAGFLPPPSLQQRTIFDEVVRPLVQEGGCVAYFVVDGLRYEMAEELCTGLQDTPATTVHLGARLAELPTVTEIGMNVLAPVTVHGRLRPVLGESRLRGFQTGEFQVTARDTRKRAMHERVGGQDCPWHTLSEVVASEVSSLKRSLARARLVVVHSIEIDEAGESGHGTAVFEDVLRKLRMAWRLLREAGVRKFVFTADHGFLLLDEIEHPTQAHGRKIDPKRRHVLSKVAADHTGEVRVALSDLGYEGAEGLHLMFPETTRLFETGNRVSFAHGGNSLQERVIPVLTVVHRSAAGVDAVRYAVRAEVRQAVMGMHCIASVVEVVAQEALAFGSRREVELAVGVVERDDVTVELCDVRGAAARGEGGIIRASVGSWFEVFFRIVGRVDDGGSAGTADSRVQIQVHHPGSAVTVSPCVITTRFEVAPLRMAASEPAGVPGSGPASRPAAGGPASWLEVLPGDGVRQVFEHLARFGSLNEAEAMDMLGGAGKLRRFSRQLEAYAAKIPFAVRIDVIGGVKRYVREGSSQ